MDGQFPHSSPDQLQKQTQAAGDNAGTTADTKRTKDQVNYRDAGSSQTRCERCKNFRWGGGIRGKGTCRIVAGSIDAGYVCDLYNKGGGGLRDLITGQPT